MPDTTQTLTTIVGLPAYKFGNHKPLCECSSCLNVIDGLRKKPYVQALEERILFAAPHIARISELESRLIQRAAELGRAKDGAELLHRTLEESRKIAQEREKQVATLTNKLGAVQQTLKSTEDRLNISQVQLTHAKDENKSLTESLEAARGLQDLTADELGAALSQVEAMEKAILPLDDIRLALGVSSSASGAETAAKVLELIHRCDLYKGQAERIGEANTKLITESKQLATERDGYAADLHAMIAEANTQRAAARLVPVLGFLLLCTILTGLAAYLGVGGAK